MMTDLDKRNEKKKVDFTEEEIEKYYQYMIESVLPEEELKDRCHNCGRYLSKVELPKGPEKKVTCLDCRDDFVLIFAELEDMGEL